MGSSQKNDKKEKEEGNKKKTQSLLSWSGVGRSYIDIRIESGMVKQLQIERYFQSDPIAIEKFGKGSWICTYYLDDILSALAKDVWMKELVESHDAVIYLRRNRNGIAIRLK